RVLLLVLLKIEAEAEDGEDRDADDGLGARVVVEVPQALGVLAVVDVLNVEVGGDDGALHDPGLVDADVELVEDRHAGAVVLAGQRDGADTGALFLDAADDRGEGEAGDEAEAGGDLPATRELEAEDGDEVVTLV